VLDALGLDKRSGVGHYTRRFGPTETRIVTPHEMPSLRTGQAMLVSESGLYKLIMRSNKPEAREFQDWVTRDVLPAIRKDGAYIMGEEKVATGEMSDLESLARAQAVVSTSSSCVPTNLMRNRQGEP